MTDEGIEQTALQLLHLMQSGDYATMEEIKAGMSFGDRVSIAGYLTAELTERYLADIAEPERER